MNELQALNNQVAELKEMVYQQKANRLVDSLYSPELAPHYMKLASHLSQASLVPKAYQGKPNDLFIAMATGYQLGMSIEQSIQAIAVINGKPCLWGDDVLGLVLSRKDCVDVIENTLIENGKVYGYECIAKRKNKSDRVSVFTLDMAKKAGLLSKPGVWQQYPERMLQMRARGFALRDAFPDVLKGIKSREEVEDYIEAEYKVVDSNQSRTEFLKKDILTKQENANENTDSKPVNEVPEMETGQANLQDGEGIENSPASQPSSETRVCDEKNSEVKFLSKKQLAEINKLIKIKSVSDERLEKAKKFYDVEYIASMTAEMADDFIKQLNAIKG